LVISPEYHPNGVVLTKIENKKLMQKEFDLVTVSRLVPWKNIDKLLQSIEGTQLSLAIVGSGPDENLLRNNARNLKNKVSFLGSKSQSEITALMMKSRIFVQLSSYEGQSFSLLQAMSLGLPVVISDIPGNTEVVSNNIDGIILENLNEEVIKSSLLKLSNNEELYYKIGSAGKLRVFNDFNLTSQLTALISQIEHWNES
jgi:glycosyltransferase involved in cell wall biosynthesis